MTRKASPGLDTEAFHTHCRNLKCYAEYFDHYVYKSWSDFGAKSLLGKLLETFLAQRAGWPIFPDAA